MFVQSTEGGHPARFAPSNLQSGYDRLLAPFDQIGDRRSFVRDEEVFGEGEIADCWFKVISGTVRTFKIFKDGRRHIAEFHFEGDFFGLDNLTERPFSSEAVRNVTLMRYPRGATEQLIDSNPWLARDVREMLLHDIVNAQNRMLMLGRMNAPERVATFLLDIAKRRKCNGTVELPMSRIDIADYLGLTIETVCRVLSALKRDGTIGIPSPHRVELRDRHSLTLVAER